MVLAASALDWKELDLTLSYFAKSINRNAVVPQTPELIGNGIAMKLRKIR